MEMYFMLPPLNLPLNEFHKLDFVGSEIWILEVRMAVHGSMLSGQDLYDKDYIQTRVNLLHAIDDVLNRLIEPRLFFLGADIVNQYRDVSTEG